MLKRKFLDTSEVAHMGGTFSHALQKKNNRIITQHPTLQKVGGKITAVLQKTRRLPKILRYIDKSSNPAIPQILQDVFGLECAHLLLEFLPLLEQIYHIGTGQDLSWVDSYGYILSGEPSEITQEQLLSLARIKQIIEGKILHSKEPLISPERFIDDNLQAYMYNVTPSQLVSVFLILELIHRRIPYLGELKRRHNDDPRSLFSEVQAGAFPQRNAFQSVSQQGPFLQFSVSRATMTILKSKKAHGLFYRKTQNRALGTAFVVTDGFKPSTQKHEQQHNINAWGTLEQAVCTRGDFYFDTKDEILAFMAGGDRTFCAIFNTMFTSELYDPYVDMKNNSLSYDYWREHYRKNLIMGLICAKLLEKKIGKRNTIDVLSFIHFRSWKSELARIFDISIPPSLEVLTGFPGKEKEVFRVLE